MEYDDKLFLTLPYIQVKTTKERYGIHACFVVRKLNDMMERVGTYINDIKTKISSEDFREGKIAKFIESQTAKLPTDVYLWAALGSMVASLTLKLTRNDKDALFVGQWAAPFLLFGVYNKLVKTHGHD
jgi:hypothetical protein